MGQHDPTTRIRTCPDCAEFIDGRNKSNDALVVERKRIAELEAALRSVVAWAGQVELLTPELGGCVKAMWEAQRVLEKR